MRASTTKSGSSRFPALLGDAGPGEVLPFRLTAQPDAGVPFPSVVVLWSPSEWRAVEKDELKLPSGWERNKLKKVG